MLDAAVRDGQEGGLGKSCSLAMTSLWEEDSRCWEHGRLGSQDSGAPVAAASRLSAHGFTRLGSVVSARRPNVVWNAE